MRCYPWRTVFVSVPYTKKSEGTMGAREFELMKHGSYFIAMSRGKITTIRRW
jgi:phosphoglycerate dehydrogenase-like enzyme